MKCSTSWVGYTGRAIVALLLLSLLLSLSHAADAPADAASPVPNIADAESAAQFRSNLFELVDSLPLVGSMLSVIWFSITNFQGWAGLTPLLIKTAITLALGWLGFLILRPTSLRRKLNQRAAGNNDGVSIALYSFVSLVLELLSIAIFYFIASATLTYLIDKIDPSHELVANIVWAVTAILLFNAVLRSILSPNNSNLRLMPIADKPAKQGFKVLLAIFAVLQLGLAALDFLDHMGAYKSLTRGGIVSLTFVINAAFIAFLWSARKHFNAVFYPEGAPDPAAQPASATMYRLWPIGLSVWLLVIWGVWSFNIFVNNEERAANVAICWWITLSFPILDRCVQLILKNVIADRVFTAPINQARGERFVNVIQTGFRIVLLIFALFTVTKAWGFQAASTLTGNSIVQQIFDVIVELGVVAVVGFAIWEIVQGWAESKMPESDIDPVAALELDGGGMGGTRTETLLPLLRTVLSAVLAVFLVLTALYVMGVKIGPLLAGAGVIGIAVGFGAQKLVQDIISGIFFLVDDAFRMGEYVEVGGMRGTIEKISIRSMQLRHHLGPVQTIPYSEMATVKNHSRDWVTMKLEIRVPYHTDVEKLRKIVKKTGLALKEHPEHGSKFLLPLKSQGVNRIEESALIIRVKFTCKPGDQWIIRRLAYQEIRDNLAAAGIHFAHREVRVHVPGTDELDSPPADQAAALPPPPADSGSPQSDAAAIAEAKEAAGKATADKADLGALKRAAAATAGAAMLAEELARSHDHDDANDL